MNDGLGHERLAAAIVSHAATLPVGSVVAIQGPWGRGKTDVLRRVHDLLEERGGDAAPEPLWLNPWQYGTPNLIAPLVVALLERIPAEARSGNDRLRRAAQTLLRAGNAIAFKALSVVVPFGEVLQAGKEPVDDLIGELFQKDGAAGPVDVDPVESMARRFRELIEEYLTGAAFEGPLVICVDDLDRCLPDHQIAMLEAIHFLTSAGARAYFVIALDPTLVKQAAGAHYAGLGFDTNQYLDKLFDLRVNLRALGIEALDELIQMNLARGDVETVLTEYLGMDGLRLRQRLASVLHLPELANPRFIARMLDRLVLFARAEMREGYPPFDATSAEALIRLVALTERWPAIRSILQAVHPDDWTRVLDYGAFYYGQLPLGWSSASQSKTEELAGMSSLTKRLPEPDRHPDAGQFLMEMGYLCLGDNVVSTLVALDRRLVAVGL